VPSLTEADVQPVLAEAVAQWTEALGPASPYAAQLEQVSVQITDLPGRTLGVTDGNTIAIDANAAGYGWFVSPWLDDGAFALANQGRAWLATGAGGAAGRIDLLTVFMHELGHELGLVDAPRQTNTMMAVTLAPGQRKFLADGVLGSVLSAGVSEIGMSAGGRAAQMSSGVWTSTSGAEGTRPSDERPRIDWTATNSGRNGAKDLFAEFMRRPMTNSIAQFVGEEERASSESPSPLAGVTEFSYLSRPEEDPLPPVEPATEPPVA
jgi:hypothetical protein